MKMFDTTSLSGQNLQASEDHHLDQKDRTLSTKMSHTNSLCDHNLQTSEYNYIGQKDGTLFTDKTLTGRCYIWHYKRFFASVFFFGYFVMSAQEGWFIGSVLL